MKRKIIYLLICLLCISATFISCSEEVVCTGHADADKNSACDICGIPVVTLTEKVEAEEEAVVDMIVSAIPENATISDIISADYLQIKVLPTAIKDGKEENLKNIRNLSNGVVAYSYEVQVEGKATEDDTTDDKFKTYYGIYDIFTGKELVSEYATDKYARSDRHHDSASVTLVYATNDYSSLSAFICVTVTDWKKTNSQDYPNDTWDSTTYNIYYSFSGTEIVNFKNAEDEDQKSISNVYLRDNIAYFELDDETVALDYEAGKIVHRESTDKFVKRPVFDYMNDKYGYVEKNDKIYVYDLSKWLECVYSYELPSTYVDYDLFYLNNGNLLIQGIKNLPDSAVNYDFLESGLKYDIVYTVVNVAEKTTSDVEFGYYIDVVRIATPSFGVKENVTHLISAYPIVNRTISEKLLQLYTDDALTIIAEYSALLPEFADNCNPISDKYMIVYESYGEGSEVNKIYDYAGKEIATLPNDAEIYDNYIISGGKLYSLTMDLIFNPEDTKAEPYEFVEIKGTYVIFERDGYYYFWNTTLASKPSRIAVKEEFDVRNSIDYVSEYGYVIRTVEYVETQFGTETETTYTLYNANNEKVLTADSAITYINYSTNSDGKSLWSVTLADGTVYFAR